MGDGRQKGGWRDNPNKKGHHSRQHATADAHVQARERYQSKHGPEARKRRAAERQKDRSPQEQLGRLVERGHGHCREALQLADLVETELVDPKKSKKGKRAT